VIDVLKAAFVPGRLAKDELDEAEAEAAWPSRPDIQARPRSLRLRNEPLDAASDDAGNG
jgi:hypothetical protein